MRIAFLADSPMVVSRPTWKYTSLDRPRIPAAASALYARNLLTFLSTFWDKEAKAPKLNPEDEIVQGVALTRGGAVVHKMFAPAA